MSDAQQGGGKYKGLAEEVEAQEKRLQVLSGQVPPHSQCRAKDLLVDAAHFRSLLQSAIGIYAIVVILGNRQCKSGCPAGVKLRKALFTLRAGFCDTTKDLVCPPAVLNESSDILLAHGYTVEEFGEPKAESSTVPADGSADARAAKEDSADAMVLGAGVSECGVDGPNTVCDKEKDNVTTSTNTPAKAKPLSKKVPAPGKRWSSDKDHFSNKGPCSAWPCRARINGSKGRHG